MTTETTDTSNGIGAVATADATAGSLLINRKDMFERVMEAGRQARAVEIVEVEAPWEIPGLPKQLQVLVKHTPAGPAIEPLRALFEPFRGIPERRRGTASTTTLASFVALVNRHKGAESVIFARTAWPNPCLTALVDYHAAGEPTAGALDGDRARWGEHRVEYAFPLTDEFTEWMAKDGRAMEQAGFARFLEDHVDQLTAPMDQERATYEPLFKEKFAAPNELIDLSRSLEINVGAKIKRKERLASGERTVIFETTHTGANGEAVSIPGIFMVNVPAFLDGEPIRMPARLRYCPAGSEGVMWFYQLYRPAFWLRAQVQNDLAAAGADTGLPCFEGAPEMVPAR